VVYVIAGLAVLTLGGEVLVRGASGMAKALGLPSFVIGLTVVSFATSAPELAVTVQAAAGGNPGLAIGNVVGSNIANILFILGICAVVLPLVVQSQLIRMDIPVMIGFSVLALVFALDGAIGRLDGALLMTGLIAYLIATIVVAKRRHLESLPSAVPGVAEDVPSPVSRNPLISTALVVGGVGLLVIGARLLVNGATDVAAAMGVSELVIGLTVVSIGTSMPELAASLVAAIRGERDIAVGNIVGSCLFNIGAVLGITGIVAPIPIADAAVNFDLPIMIAVALALVPVAFTGFTVARWEGALFVAFYVAYVAYLLLDATGHEAVEPFSGVMMSFVLPITALWLIVLMAYEVGLRRGRREGAR
jgi:cation:H+ antiporter